MATNSSSSPSIAASYSSKSDDLSVEQVEQISLDAQDQVDLNDIVCLQDFEDIARNKLDSITFNYIYCGSDEQITQRLNHQMIVDKYFLKPRCFRDVSKIDTIKYIYGDKLSMPIGIAPTSLQKAFNPRGELATVRASSNLNALMILSQFSTTSLEDVAKEAPICTKWQNIYLIKDRDHTMNIINRAIRYGYRAIVISCDRPVSGHRRRCSNKPLDGSKTTSLPKLVQFQDKDRLHPVLLDPNAQSKYNKQVAFEWDDTKTWLDVADLKRSLGDTIRIIVKGILTPEDASNALDAGVDGIYVSNSGGIQLDCCQSTIEALPEIVKVVNKRVPIFIDGGFTTGNDVMKALALGADMVFLGRPILYSLAVKGERGIEHALKLVHEELIRCMAHCGCKNLEDVTGDIIMERK